MTTIITIRPEPDASNTVTFAGSRGLAVEAFPLSEIVARAWEGPDPANVDALLVASGNAIRHGGDGLERYKDKPVFAVGEKTAKIAENAGFSVHLAGDGGLVKLLGLVEQKPIRLLRLAGARNLDIDVPEDITIYTTILYEAVNLPMPDVLADKLREDALVLLHSAGAAEHFGAECDRLGLDRSTIRIATMGPRIADAAGQGWAELRAASQPAAGALLALAADMCQ